jgi:pimeloyl-ACP methyl ester carboxylesterase
MPRELWWEKNGDFDPMEYWRVLQIPSLMIFGKEDQNVDVARSLLRLREAGLLDRKSFKTKVFPGLSHALISPETGWLEREYLASLARFVHQEE